MAYFGIEPHRPRFSGETEAEYQAFVARQQRRNIVVSYLWVAVAVAFTTAGVYLAITI